MATSTGRRCPKAASSCRHPRARHRLPAAVQRAAPAPAIGRRSADGTLPRSLALRRPTQIKMATAPQGQRHAQSRRAATRRPPCRLGRAGGVTPGSTLPRPGGMHGNHRGPTRAPEAVGSPCPGEPGRQEGPYTCGRAGEVTSAVPVRSDLHAARRRRRCSRRGQRHVGGGGRPPPGPLPDRSDAACRRPVGGRRTPDRRGGPVRPAAAGAPRRGDLVERRRRPRGRGGAARVGYGRPGDGRSARASSPSPWPSPAPPCRVRPCSSGWPTWWP